MKNGRIYKPTYRIKKTGEKRESAIYWMKYYVDGKCHQESTHTKSKKDAMKVLAQRTAKAAIGEPIMPRMHRVKFDELAKGVVRDYERNDRDTVNDVKTRLRLNVLPFFGNRRAMSITTEMIDKYIDLRLTQKTRRGKAPARATINRELAIIKRAFSLAMKKKMVTVAPYVPTLKEDNVRKGFYEPERFEIALEHLGDNLSEDHANVVRDFVRFQNHTGWRSKESKGLLWEYIDFDAGRVYLDKSKNKNARYFPITDELRAILERRKAYQRDCQLRLEKLDIPYVFQRDGNQLKNCERSWQTACEKAGMGDRLMHDFRRTAVRGFRRNGIADKVAMKLTGHKTRSVYDRYNIVDEKDMDAAAALLNGAAKKEKGTVSGTVAQKECNSEIREVVNK